MGNVTRRYTRAVGSGNLKNDAWHYDPEVIMAVALSSTHGGLLFRAKYGNDPTAYRQLRDKWTWIVSTKAVRRKWPLHVPIDKVARISLRLWANDVCPACTGRRQQTIFNTPSLSGKDCPLCNGSGKAELRCDQSLRDYVLDMIEDLFHDERLAGARGARKLGKENNDISEFMPAQKNA